jgi:hypothetical protein
MELLKSIVVLFCALIGLYLGVQFMPNFYDIIYPFSPTLRLRVEENLVFFRWGFCSAIVAFIGAHVYQQKAIIGFVSTLVALFIFTAHSFWYSTEQFLFYFEPIYSNELEFESEFTFNFRYLISYILGGALIYYLIKVVKRVGIKYT